MLYYNRIHVSEGIALTKTSEWIEFDICHYYNLVSTMVVMTSIRSMNLSNIAVLNIHNADYHCVISKIIKNETTNLLKNANLTEKSRTSYNIIFAIVYKR